jgi:hypothetical protein
MGMIHVLDGTGDTKTIWDPKSEDEVEVAEQQFKKLIAKGYTAYKVDKEGNKSSQVKSFNKAYEKLIFVPPMAGG